MRWWRTYTALPAKPGNEANVSYSQKLRPFDHAVDASCPSSLLFFFFEANEAMHAAHVVRSLGVQPLLLAL